MHNMRIFPMRKPMPDRRKSFTQKVHIEGQTVYLTVGLYEDGTPGEIFIDIARAGTFVRGVLGTCGRAISIALQCGAPLDMVTHMLRGHDYPPHGMVVGSEMVTHCTSVMDWVASELEAMFRDNEEAQIHPSPGEGDVSPVTDKPAGHVSESWRAGA